MSKSTFSFTTDDPALAAQAMALFSGSKVTAPAAPAPAPAPVSAAPAPAAPQGEAPPGWTIAHVTGALQTLGANAAKGGPAAVAALLTKYGAKSVTGINPALWPQVYADATAA